MKKLRALLAGLLLGGGGLALAATFNLFSPATGILKGSSSTYVTTAATGADIGGTFTGCSSGVPLLKYDGSCVAAGTTSPAGSDTQVQYNNAGSFGASSGLTFTATGSSSNTLTVGINSFGVLNNGKIQAPAGKTLVIGGQDNSAGTGGTIAILGGTSSSPGANGGAININAGSPGSGGIAGQVSIGITNTSQLNLGAGSVGLIIDSTGAWNLSGGIDPGTAGYVITSHGAGTPPTWAAPGSGVTSVGLTMPAVFSVSGSPVTSAGTLAVSAAGTSGGIPYFDTATSMASSAALGANQIVLGGGAGAAPSTLGSLGTTTTVLHGNAAGAPTFGAVANSDLTNSSITINGTSVSLGGSKTLTLASADFANQGTTTTVLHGNAAGNPSFGAVSLSADVAGTLADGSLSANVALYNASMASFSSGTLADARLSSNIPKLNAGGNFTVAPTISSKNICLADGTNCPAAASTKLAYAVMSVSGGVCTVLSTSGFTSSAVSGCSYSAAGLYSVTVSGYSNKPVCNVSQTGTSAHGPEIGTALVQSTSAINVQFWQLTNGTSLTWTSNDPDGFTFTCMGT